MIRQVLFLQLLFLVSLALAEERGDVPSLQLLFRDDFRKGSDRWQPTDPAAWKVIDAENGKAFNQFQQSKYKPPHRSPLNFSLVKDLVVGDFVLEAKARSTTKDYDHRDLCLFFGYQDPAHFYYVHLGKKADDRANQIFIVNDAPRSKITMKGNDGTPWTEGWHPVKVVRKVKEGTIEVYFDDMKTPVMTANDKTFAWGQVGVGSFDDTGSWMDVKVSGVKVEKEKK